MKLGITDPNLQKKLQEEIDRHFVEQKNAQLKAAELEKPVKKSDEDNDKEEEESREALCSEISSAPEGYEPDVPVHVSAECVVCLDNQVCEMTYMSSNKNYFLYKKGTIFYSN